MDLDEEAKRLVRELGTAISAEVEDSEKIARVIAKLAQHGIKAGIEITPFLRPSKPASGAKPPTQTGTEEAASKPAPPQLSPSDLRLLKAMRICAWDEAPPDADGTSPPSTGPESDTS